MTNIFYPTDYKFGTEQENVLLPLLQNYFSRDIKKSADRYAKHDFYDNEYNYEVKSRTNTYSKYPTTMITEDKICGEKKLILLFNFTDGLYFIEYNEERFATYDRQMFSRANIEWNKKSHVYIPIDELQPVVL
jgi:hypothetical protein